MPQEHLGLFDTPPTRRQVQFSLVIVGLLFAALLVILPVRDVPLRPIHAFIPMANAIMFLGELITATLLYAQTAVFRSRALAVVGTVYVFTALLLIPHALTFPGAFAPDGLLGAGINTTAWIAWCRRVSFPIAIFFYVQLRRAESAAPPEAERPAAGIVIGVIAAIALAAGVTALTTIGQALLPPFFVTHSRVAYANSLQYESVVFVLSIIATILLFRTRRSVLDLWLLVVFAGWLTQSLLILSLHGRFTVGWYWLFLVSVFSHLVVMLALLAESHRLYLRLALSTSARNRERESRLMSIDAVAAAISHEIGQPLAAARAYATAGVSWLDRPQPDPERAVKSMRAAIDAAQRTADVIKSIRAMFAQQPGMASEVDLNDLARATASALGRELAGEKVSLQLTLDEALPPILADRVQIEQVLVNLITNAIESLGATRGRARRIAIRSTALNGHDVLLQVSDNGVGITDEAMSRIFEAFFTTKKTGMGMGLSLCRTIVEAHGGRLWAAPGEKHGVTFYLQLPRSDLHAA
ncbi:hypothetical protein ASD38_04605 [Caulobacter sp. Root487D2Y]|nr:hypothetical protein ASD38_04605 [Caulobacter sp. Root487D2Y]